MANPKSANIENRAENRPTRIPVSGDARNVLSVLNQDPNYVYRWVNDMEKGFRVKRFLDAGYEFVTDPHTQVGDGHDPSDPLSIGSAVTLHVGGGTVAYLMRIKKEWYEEDQARKAKEIEETERMLGKSFTANEGTYGKVQISSR